MKHDGLELFFSIMLIFFSGFPLIEILSKSLAIDQISNFSLIVIVIWLVVILVSSIIYFVSYWMEKFDQLHFKGAVYTVPEIYQESKLKFVQAYITVQVCIKSQMGTKQLPITLLNSVITLENDYFQVKKRKNVRQQETMEWFKYNQ